MGTRLFELVEVATKISYKRLFDYIDLEFDGDASREQNGMNVLDCIIESNRIDLFLELHGKIFNITDNKPRKILFIDKNQNWSNEYTKKEKLREFLLKNISDENNRKNIEIIKRVYDYLEFTNIEEFSDQEKKYMFKSYDLFEKEIMKMISVSQSELDFLSINRLDKLKDFKFYNEFIKRCSSQQKILAFDRVVNSFIKDRKYNVKCLDFIFELYAGNSRKKLIDYLLPIASDALISKINEKLIKIINKKDNYLIETYYKIANRDSYQEYNYIPEEINDYEQVKKIHESYGAEMLNNKFNADYYTSSGKINLILKDLLDKIDYLKGRISDLERKNNIILDYAKNGGFNPPDDYYDDRNDSPFDDDD